MGALERRIHKCPYCGTNVATTMPIVRCSNRECLRYSCTCGNFNPPRGQAAAA